MESLPEPHPAASRASSSGDISWHSANTAKTHQALSLFANVRANLHATPATSSHSAAAAAASAGQSAARRGSVPPANRAHTPRAVTRSNSMSRPTRQQQRRGSSTSTSPTREAAVPLIYTDAEVATMSPAQLRRQLRVASAVTQRLHRRTRQLERDVEKWKGKCAAQQPDSGDRGPVNSSEAYVHAVRAAEQRAEALQAQLEHLANEKEALLLRLQKAQHDGAAAAKAKAEDGALDSPASTTPAAGAITTGVARREESGEVTLLRDTVQQLQRRLDLSEQRVLRAIQLQLDAVLLHRTTTTTAAASSPPPPPSVAMVNAEVQRLFQLMQEQLQSNAAQQQAERARMNELFYQLERQRGLS